jgi:uncharacterized protein (TIGR03435 family)
MLLTISVISAQSAGPAFEVVSIKPPARPGGRGAGAVQGGPGTTSPGQVRIANMPVRSIILRAYGLQEYQLTSPAWTESERYDILAKVPAKATKAATLPMLQQLLKERFQLAVHRENREIAGYGLTVAKGGLKFKESGPAVASTDAAASTRVFDQDGFSVLAPGRTGTAIDFPMEGGPHRLTSAQETMANFVVTLSKQLGKPVADATGLAGKYDFHLSWMTEVTPMYSDRPPYTPDGPDLPAALALQLGLKLEPRKVQTEIVIVDRVEKPSLDN